MANNQPGSTSSREPTKSMLRRTLFLLAVCGIVAFIVLGARLFKLQVVDHDYYEGLALSQQVRETSSMASRGTIYDTNMMVLAMSSDVETVFISPAEMTKNNEDPTLIAKGLSQILGVDYADILDKTKNTDSWYEVVARKVESKVSDQVQEFKKSNKLVSIHLEADTKRYYPYGSLACHVIGFVGSDNNGLGGIEYEYNSVLTGTAGRTVRATTAAGTDLMFTQFEDYYSSENGYNAVTTIDAKIQYYIEKHLEQAVQDYDVTNGAGAIAMSGAKGVKGRVEVVPTDGDYTIIIDYAHTPDALENVLRTMKQVTSGKLVALFGCGGDRDRTKRPIMGAIAAQLADMCIVTSDNPRTEEPQAIIDEIVAGMKGSRTPTKVIPDRREAICWAIDNHCPGDVIVLAGKGHEDYQVIGHEKHHMRRNCRAHQSGACRGGKAAGAYAGLPDIVRGRRRTYGNKSGAQGGL